MSASEVAIVLVRPARAGNVAAACRAMKNMGLFDLRLVGPPAELREPEARALAYGAFDVLESARSFDALPAALSDTSFVVATSGRPDLRALSPRDLAAARRTRTGRGPMAVVFGPERTGLLTEELRLCHATVRIPAHPAHGSLNLAQAVLIVAYELFLAETGEAVPAAPAEASTTGELETVLADLKAALVAIGYLNPERPDAILAELRSLLARAGPTPRELNLLRGVARQAAWAGRVAAQRRRDG